MMFAFDISNNDSYGIYKSQKSRDTLNIIKHASFPATCTGFDADKLADAIFTHFGPGTVYEDARKQTSKPIKGPWTNHNIKIFLANREKGASPAADPSSSDPDGLCKAIVVIGLLSGKPELLDAVEKCVKTTQVCLTIIIL